MCTLLVVREEYWDCQLAARLQLLDIDVDVRFIKQWSQQLIIFTRKTIKKMQERIALLAELGRAICQCVKESFRKIITDILKLFEDCEITSVDSFETVCDRLENRMLYLNRQECIRQEQYYKSQFKLAKISYNIMNHDRRC